MVKQDKKATPSIFLNENEYKKIRLADDSLVIKMIKKGNPLAYKEIGIRYRNKLFAYIYHLVGNKDETEDILQNVFLKVYRNIKSFDTKRKFSSWIYRIAHNEAVNYLKRKSRKKFMSLEDVVSLKDKKELRDEEESPADAWIKKELQNEVNKALGGISAKYKEVLLLRYFLDKSYEEISGIIGKPVNTVGTLINRAKKKLFEEMSEKKN